MPDFLITYDIYILYTLVLYIRSQNFMNKLHFHKDHNWKIVYFPCTRSPHFSFSYEDYFSISLNWNSHQEMLFLVVYQCTHHMWSTFPVVSTLCVIGTLIICSSLGCNNVCYINEWKKKFIWSPRTLRRPLLLYKFINIIYSYTPRHTHLIQQVRLFKYLT